MSMPEHSSLRRISALLLRYLYLLRSSWPRIIEIAYWPTMQLIIWGFVTKYFSDARPELSAAGVLISAVLIWDSLFRSHVSYTLSFLEELWSRNLANLFVTPLRPWELIASLASISMLRTLIGIVPAALLAIPFFGVSVFDMGFPPFGLLHESRPLRLGHLASGYGHSHPLWFGCGKPDMGSTLSYRSRFLHLLSDRDLAAMVADHSKRYFNFLRVRRHALSFVAT